MKVNNYEILAVDVAQLVEGSPLTPELCSSNPVIGRFYFQSTVLELAIIKEKGSRVMNGQLK